MTFAKAVHSGLFLCRDSIEGACGPKVIIVLFAASLHVGKHTHACACVCVFM